MSIGDGGEGEKDYHPHPISNLLLLPLKVVGINCFGLAKILQVPKGEGSNVSVGDGGEGEGN